MNNQGQASLKDSPAMTIPLKHAYSLVPRGGAGLACDEDGLALGTLAVVRARQDATGVRHSEVRSPDEIDQILRAAFGPQPDGAALRIHRGLRRAATWIEAGDLGRAGVEAVKLGVSALLPEAMAKLAAFADLEKGGEAWQDQPRVPAGQTGGGQWTDGAGDGQFANPSPPAKPPARPTPHKAPQPPLLARPKPPQRAPVNEGQGLTPAARSLLVHVNAPSAATGLPSAYASGAPRITAPSITLPVPTPAEVVTVGARLLDASTVLAAKHQISDAISRFGLDANQPSDRMAAAAYVWSVHHIADFTEAPYSGPALDAASQAVMRFVMIHPDAFAPILAGGASSAILDAANAGLADYGYESRARPAGVEPALQTTSWSARAAIASYLRTGKMQAHHLVSPNVWALNVDIARIAALDGWRPDAPSNLIALPADPTTQAALANTLPMHRGPHPIYDTTTRAMFEILRNHSTPPLTPLRAHAILFSIAETNRRFILSGVYHPIIKITKLVDFGF